MEFVLVGVLVGLLVVVPFLYRRAGSRPARAKIVGLGVALAAIGVFAAYSTLT